MPASIDTSVVPTPICLLPFLMSSTLPRNESCGCLPWVACSCGPSGQFVSAFCAESPMHAMVDELPPPAAALLGAALLGAALPDDGGDDCAIAEPDASASATHNDKKNATR